MGNIYITGKKKGSRKRKKNDNNELSEHNILKYNISEQNNNSINVEDHLHKLVEHTKNYNVENSLIIIPEKVLNNSNFDGMDSSNNSNDKQIDFDIEDLLQNYKIIHISNIDDENINNELIKNKMNKNDIKNILITNLLVNYDKEKYESIKKDNKLLKKMRGHKKKHKSTDMYLEHYCSLVKKIINNLEYKWDWQNKSLISDLSHQLKTPLTGLLTGIQILSKNKKSKYDKMIIEHLFKSCLELSTHINNITDYYFINQNDIKLNYNIIHVENILLHIKKIYKTQLRENNNKFVYSIDDTSNKIIMQDKDKLHKVLYSLVNNSVKFTENGYIYIHIFISDNGERYYFRIYDTGKEVAKEDREYLFDPFYKMGERKEHIFREGIGLGLSICKKIVNAMKGSIYFIDCYDALVSNLIPHVKTKKKFTNCVEFWFPMNINDDIETDELDNIVDIMDTTIHTLGEIYDENNIESESIIDIDNIEEKNIRLKRKRNKRKLPKPPSVSKINTINSDDSVSDIQKISIKNDYNKCKKILIVEDHKANSSLIKLMIHNIISSKIIIDIENESENAYDDIINGNYNYILLDLRMPKVSGFDILSRLKKNNYFERANKAKIIVITALLSNDVEDLKEKYPTTDIVYKPIDVKQLAEKLLL